jgi:hypothetical protein
LGEDFKKAIIYDFFCFGDWQNSADKYLLQKDMSIEITLLELFDLFCDILEGDP